MKKAISLLLVVTMLLSTGIVYAAESNSLDNFAKKAEYTNQFTDVPSNAWYRNDLKSVYECGLMIGNSATTFNPNGNITEAEALTIAARLNMIYKTGKDDFSSVKQEMQELEPTVLQWVDNDKNNPAYKEFYGAWYSVYAYYLCSHTEEFAYPIYPFLGAVPDQAPFINSTTAISRERFAYYLAHALPKSELKEINTVEYDAIPDVVEKDNPEIYLLYRAGILTGNDEEGTFAPDSGIKRSEVAAIVNRLINQNFRKNITLKNANKVDTKLSVSSNNLRLDSPASIWVTLTVDYGKFPNGITLIADYDASKVEVAWGAWDGDTCSLTFYPVGNGSCNVRIYAQEDSSIFKSIHVSVFGQSLENDTGTDVPVVTPPETGSDGEDTGNGGTDSSTDDYEQKLADYHAYEQVINAKIAAIRAEGTVYWKSEETFQKEVNELNAEISNIQKQIAAMTGDTSASAVAKRKQLEAQLQSKQEELDELYAQHSRKVRIEALEAELKRYHDELFG